MTFIKTVQKLLKALNENSLRDLMRLLYYRLTIDKFSFIVGGVLFKIKTFWWGIECGKSTSVWGRVVLIRGLGTKIIIRDNVSIVSSSSRSSASSQYSRFRLRTFNKGAKIIIENGVGLNGTSITARSQTIRICEGTMVAPNVIIVDSDFHAIWPPQNRLSNAGLENDESVYIDKNVWIGMNTIILKGVNIGKNSIIGAGSVVTSDIPADCIAAGNPARIIKHLNT
jgi:acetyltransferase-like isoleucine patch superfamily enzyme